MPPLLFACDQAIQKASCPITPMAVEEADSKGEEGGGVVEGEGEGGEGTEVKRGEWVMASRALPCPGLREKSESGAHSVALASGMKGRRKGWREGRRKGQVTSSVVAWARGLLGTPVWRCGGRCWWCT